MIEYNRVIIADYHSYLVNFNLENYFCSKKFELDKINSSKLDLRRTIHKSLFVQKIKEYIEK